MSTSASRPRGGRSDCPQDALGDRYPNVFYREVVRPGRKRPVRVYEVGYRDNVTGKQRWKTVGPSLDAALGTRDDVLRRRRNGERVEPSHLTFEALLGVERDAAGNVERVAWVEGRSQLRRRTKEHYATTIRVHLLPRFGRRKVGSITEDDVAALIADLQAGRGPNGERRRSLAPCTVRGVLTVLGRIMGRERRRCWPRGSAGRSTR